MPSVKTKTRINLLTEDFRIPNKLRVLKTISFVALGIYLFVLLLLFAVTFLFSRQEKSLQDKNASLAQEVNSQKEKEGFLNVIKDRLSLARDVYAKSGTTTIETVDNIINLFGQGVEIISIDSAEEGSGVIVAARAINSAGVRDVFEKIKTKQFVGVSLENLALQEDGYYAFSLAIR